MTREQLIAALEKATGPAFELDRAITKWAYEGGGYMPSMPNPFTSSIDAALTLVPKGWEWVLDGGTGMSRVCFLKKNEPAIDLTASTPALAICMASIKARTP
jgi:hypothetical protein